MRWVILASVLLSVPLISGCAEKATPKAAVVSESNPGFGDLDGRLLDGEQRPIAGVEVSLRGPSDERDLKTDASGAYSAESLAAGPYVVSFYHPRFVPFEDVIRVRADERTTIETVLTLLPENRPYARILAPMRGHYDCAAEAVILTGDCMILWENVTQEPSPITAYQNSFLFNITRGWTTAIVQLEYTSGANNRLDGMRLYLAPANESRDPAAHHTKVAVAEGNGNPLEIRLETGKAQAKADTWKPGGAPAQVPSQGGEMIGLVYPRGNLADTTGEVCEPNEPDRCFLGVGAALSIDFTAHVGLFYNGLPVPAGFTMVL